MEDYRNALKSFNKALDLDENLAEAWAAIGGIFVKQKLEKTATKYYLKAIRLMPLNIEFKYDLAMVYLQLEQFEKAEELFREVVEKDPNHIQAWIEFSFSKSVSDGLEKAIDIIEESLEQNKDEASLWLRLAAYLYQNEKIQQAFYYIETALKLNPEKWAEILEYLPELKEVSQYRELVELYRVKE
jgi:Tfp pilus assembly protein PilF